MYSARYITYSIMDVDLKYIVMCQLGGTKVESNFRDTIHSTRNARVRSRRLTDPSNKKKDPQPKGEQMRRSIENKLETRESRVYDVSHTTHTRARTHI